MITLKEAKDLLAEKEAKEKILLEQYDKNELRQKILKEDINDHIEARDIVAEASRLTQEQFKILVEELVTSAIQSVFPDRNYQFIVEFILQNNRPQINLMVKDGETDEIYIPKDEQGGGLLDIISFALRVVLWSLTNPRTRNVIIMDEPFKWTGSLTEEAAVMMKEISKNLGLQIIMVTHDERLMDVADRSWLCRKGKSGISTIFS
jgi:DNA repair exonuclease SbcCD ATPase subunit